MKIDEPTFGAGAVAGPLVEPIRSEPCALPEAPPKELNITEVALANLEKRLGLDEN